jgi:hypothetical protein
MKKLLAVPLLILALAPPACAAKSIQIVTRSLAQGQTTVAYSADLGAKFGVKPYSWSVTSGTLPTGLAISTLANGKGRISGTPTVAGTYNFVVRVTGSTTDDQGFFIIITGTAPPPTPVVSISTTSLPDGIVGGAYSATLQATGGTAPYTWSTTAGALPPAATLTGATGAIAGTLTASGTYSASFRVTDSSTTPQTADRAFAVTVDSAVAPTYLFSDSLESFAAWDFVWRQAVGNPVIAACPGGGNCAQFRYAICGDSTNSACGAAHQDINRWVSKIINPGLSDSWFRALVYLKTPEAGAVAYPLQRKLFYLGDSLSAGTQGGRQDGTGGWSAILTSESTVSGIALRWSQNNSTVCGITAVSYYPTGTLTYNTFYTVETHSQLNTPGVADGVLDVYVDGVSKLHQTGVNFRGTCTTDMSFYSLGTQTDRNNYIVVDEYRYWKNAVINNSYVGP